jgi:AraC-like DNA-binding protein
VVSLRMLRRARDRIDRDYAERIDIPALAAGAGYSREHFIRAFRTTYGETPGRYRTRRRVERACELLRSANLTVTEICHLVGFTSLGTFSARFAELTGMSPTAYRKQAAERGGPAPIPGCYALMWRAGLQSGGLANASLPEKRRAPGRAVQSRHEPQAHQPGQLSQSLTRTRPRTFTPRSWASR